MPDSAFRVLEILERATTPLSGETISNELKITRSAVWKHINELRTMGYDISSSQKEGYRLTRTSNKLLPYEVHKKLQTKFIGKKMRYLESTPSTIWVGKQLCSEGDVDKMQIHGLVIIAEEQSGGVGRMGTDLGLTERRYLDHDRAETHYSGRPYIHDNDGGFHRNCPGNPERVRSRGAHQVAE